MTETKIVQTTGPALADVIREQESAGWRVVAIEVTGAADYELRLVRVVERQGELLP